MSQSTDSYENNLFSNHFLEERIQDLDEWEQASVESKFDELKQIYEDKKSVLSEKLNEDQTQQHFIDPILQKLGHEWVPEAQTRVGSSKRGTVLNPDYTFMDMETQMKVHDDSEKEYFDVNYAVGDAKAWNRTLDKSTEDHRNPAFQIYNYVDRLRSDWGILTNGKKWRLYSYEDCAADIYFEIDLEEVLRGEKTEEKLEAFKYFYIFFKAESFEQGFLEKVYQQSVNYSEELEDDLEDKVYNALEASVKGFFETNDLEKTEENIDLVHRSSLIYLYRNLFILNAESRGLLPVDNEIYRSQLSFEELKEKMLEDEEDTFPENTWLWQERISNLFDAINDGRDYGDFEIPAYNGGLFDHEESKENKFLAENQLQGNHIKEILQLLATTKVQDQKVLVDYKDLNIRHLGSVYEGLLEHEFKAANERKILKKGEWQKFSETDKAWENFEQEKRVEENELYLTNESGERKATGSYYTPEYIVEYIVENTVGPKVEEKIEEGEENNENILPKILELNVCDPAMGSGHFLTEATEYIAENIVEHCDLKKQDIDENEDELNWAKRQVVQNCIYGVDINELAVELGKLSLWIETMAEGKPLNFLDHHLKHGNSLIGSDFDQIFSHPTEKQKRLDHEDFNFSPKEAKENFQRQYKEIEQMPENTVEQIHEKEQAYKKFISNNTLYQQFQQLANIHTRQHFNKEANSSDYESFLINIGNPSNPFEENEWYKNAQSDAENRSYFHWQLEFPKVFFGEQNGFDAVVGNPPYVTFKTLPDHLREVYSELFDTFRMKGDMYVLFMELSHKITRQKGQQGFIIQNKFTKASYGEGLRSLIAEEEKINEIIDFHDSPVFEISAYPMILLRTKEDGDREFKWRDIREDNSEDIETELFSSEKGWKIDQSDLGSDSWSVFASDSSIGSETVQLGEFADQIGEGVASGARDVYTVDKETVEERDFEEEFIKPVLRGGDIEKYRVSEKDLSYLIYPYRTDEDGNNELVDEKEIPNIIEYLREHEDHLRERRNFGSRLVDNGYEWYEFKHAPEGVSNPKLLFPDISPESRFASDETGELFCLNTVYYLVRNQNFQQYTSTQLIAILNSSFSDYVFGQISPKVRGGHMRYKSQYVEKFPVPKLESEKLDSLNLEEKVEEIKSKKSQLENINLNIQDYLGNYSDGKTLGELYTPVEGLSERVLSDTSADRDSLRIGSVEFEERNNQLILKASARYKPEDSENIDEDELDRWGYFETDLVPAMKFSGSPESSGSRSEDDELRAHVDEKLKPLIEEFVALAVDEAGGFANFRESATKTNSVVDRLEKLTLPKLEDVESGLEKFIENREEAKELGSDIQETDELIDAIVFDLYDLTEEEVETVLHSLDTSKDEKASILEKFGNF